jgi:hypothetical protein
MVNDASTKVTNELSHTGSPLQTLAKADKLIVTAERADDGKLRCTCTTWDDAVVILKGEALTLVNIERQVLPCAKAPAGVWYIPPPASPISVRLFRGPSRRGGSAPPR